MALTPEDITALGELLDTKIDAKLGAQAESQKTTEAANAEKDYARTAGVPDVDPTAGPTYYVHLANGDVVESQNAGATHMSVGDETVQVIGRWEKDARTVTAEKAEKDTEAAK